MNHFPVLNKESVKSCEKDFLQVAGLSEKSLSELTGFACAREILNYYGPFDNDHIVIYAGPGNNGNDGFSTAFFLAPYAKKISIYIHDSFAKYLIINNMERIKAFYPNIELVNVLTTGDIYIDALFGTGLTKKIENTFEQIIKTLNQQTNPVISIDIPSGADADTAISLGEVVQPDLTLAIGCLKPIHKHARAETICGKIIHLDIGLPHQLIEKYAEIQKIAC